MQRTQDVRPRARSPFVAAFLSLLFPGLGHAYARAWQRALGFAAPLILIGALLAGIFLRMSAPQLLEFALTPWVIPSVFVVNLILLIYRLVAIIDAYRVTVYLNAFASSGGGRLGRPRMSFTPLSVAGLLAVILVMAGFHLVVAKYDVLANDVLHHPCIFLSNHVNRTAHCHASDPPSPASRSPRPTR